MADATEATTTAPDSADNGTNPAEKVEDHATDWKAEARKWEARARANKDASDKLTQIEEAQKTEAQKLTDRAETAERALNEAKAEQTRLAVIAKHGIPANLQHLVKGADESELTAAAESLAELTKPDPNAGRVVVPGDQAQDIPLNGEGIENALKSALNLN